MDKELQEAYFATNYSQEVIQEIGPVSGAILAGLVTLSLYKSLKKGKYITSYWIVVIVHWK